MKKFAHVSLLSLTVLLTSLALTANAFALPLTTTHNWMLKSKLGVFYTPGFNFDNIVALSNCSGSIVRFKSSQDSDKALLLTNGHCVSKGVFGGMISPGEVLVNVAQAYKLQILSKTGATLRTVSTSRILYATMTSTDVALMELNDSYQEIEKTTGVRALIIADTAPALGMEIQIPSGYWRRTYTCQTDVLIPELREGGYVFRNSIRFSQPGCETIGGTSGSPLVSSATGEVIGINNTGNEDGEECTMNNPCEVDQNGTVSVHKDRSYGQQTYLFYGCLSNNAARLDLNQASCQLPKP